MNSNDQSMDFNVGSEKSPHRTGMAKKMEASANGLRWNLNKYEPNLSFMIYHSPCVIHPSE
jgi:hypothetical protein